MADPLSNPDHLPGPERRFDYEDPRAEISAILDQYSDPPKGQHREDLLDDLVKYVLGFERHAFFEY